VSDETVKEVPVTVIIFPRGQCADRDRVALNGIGFTVVEADDPSKVVIALPVVPFVTPTSVDDLFRSLVESVADNDFAAGKFGRALVLRIKNQLAAEGART
jgi:hypothetical protein